MRYFVARDMLLKQSAQSIMELPRLEKAVLHASTKTALAHKKNILPYCIGFQLCTAQTPTLTRAKQSVASFRLKKSQVLGWKVTLRKKALSRFVHTWTTVVLPRVKDCAPARPKGRYLSFGCESFLVFPHTEHLYEVFESCTGFQCTFVCSSNGAQVASGYTIPVVQEKNKYL